MSCSWVSGKVSGRCSGSEPRSLLWPGDHLSRLNRTANVVKGRYLAKQPEYGSASSGQRFQNKAGVNGV